MILGDGITRITELQAAGVRIGLGTDGGCTNNRLSVFEEMRMAALLQKVRHLDGTRLPAEDAFAMGTRGGGRAARHRRGGHRARARWPISSPWISRTPRCTRRRTC